MASLLAIAPARPSPSATTIAYANSSNRFGISSAGRLVISVSADRPMRRIRYWSSLSGSAARDRERAPNVTFTGTDGAGESRCADVANQRGALSGSFAVMDRWAVQDEDHDIFAAAKR